MIQRQPVISERALLSFVGCLALIVAAMAVFRWVMWLQTEGEHPSGRHQFRGRGCCQV